MKDYKFTKLFKIMMAISIAFVSVGVIYTTSQTGLSSNVFALETEDSDELDEIEDSTDGEEVIVDEIDLSEPESEEVSTQTKPVVTNQTIQPRSILSGYEISSSTLNGSFDSLADAFTAINNDSGSDYVVKVTGNDASIGTPAEVKTNKNVTLTSAGSTTSVLTQTTYDTRHINVFGTLTLENIILDGATSGGGVVVSSGTLHISSGAAIQNCYASGSGGAINAVESTITMSGGLIDNNKTSTSGVSGGGLFLEDNTTFDFSGGTISNNTSTWGGGVEVGEGVVFTMRGGIITGNKTTSAYGGGVHVASIGTFRMNAGTIDNNTSSVGGGVFVGEGTHIGGAPYSWALFEMNGGTLSNNIATSTGGGAAANYNGNIVMNGGLITKNTAPGGGGIMVTIGGYSSLSNGVSLIVNGGEISDNTATTAYGGAIFVWGSSADNSHFTIEIGDKTGTSTTSPLITNNKSATQAGGIMIYDAEVQMYDGIISKNQAGNLGGGVCVYYRSSFTMSGGQIGGEKADGNIAGTSGGGIATYNGNNSLTISDSVISGNTANSTASGGGGIYVGGGDQPTISNSIINNNTAINGGGIYVPATSKLSLKDSSEIINNTATNEGGGIYTANYSDYQNLTNSDYQNLEIENTTIFNGNTANNPYDAPTIASTYANINYATTSLIDGSGAVVHPINNYDINYTAPTPLALYCKVTYDPNGGSGNVYSSVDEKDSTYTILGKDDSNLLYSREGYTFTGWNTAADGSGSNYSAGSQITLSSDVNLYAQWKITTHNVTYDPNGGVGSSYSQSHNHNSTHTVLSDSDAKLGYYRDGYKFTGWNSKADGSGTLYSATDIIMITGDVTLYAQWSKIPTTPITPPTQTSAAYKVEHYLQKADGSYELKEMENKSGDIGTTVSADYKTYTGYVSNTFHINTKQSGVIESDGSLVLKLYYNSIEREATFKPSTDPNANSNNSNNNANMAGVNSGDNTNSQLLILLLLASLGVVTVLKLKKD